MHAMKIQRHISFNTIITQRLLLVCASKFSTPGSLSFLLCFHFFLSFFFFFWFSAFRSYGRLLSSDNKTLSLDYNVYVPFEKAEISFQPLADCSFVCESHCELTNLSKNRPSRCRNDQ